MKVSQSDQLQITENYNLNTHNNIDTYKALLYEKNFKTLVEEDTALRNSRAQYLGANEIEEDLLFLKSLDTLNFLK